MKSEPRRVALAHFVSVTGCGCPCGAVYVRLHARDGAIFALAPMRRAEAEAFAASFEAARHPSPETRFAATACQGNA